MAYSAEIASTVCDRLAEGVSLRSICAKDGMPSVGAFLGWVAADPALAEQYAHARALCMDAMAEQILEIADTPQIGQKSVSKATGIEITEGDMIEHRRLQVDARKWLMSKMAPKRYGDKLAIGGADDLPPIRTMSDEQLEARVNALRAKISPEKQD